MGFLNRFFKGKGERVNPAERARQIALDYAEQEADVFEQVQRQVGLTTERIKKSQRELGDGGKQWAELAAVKIMDDCGLSRDEARRIAFDAVSKFWTERYGS